MQASDVDEGQTVEFFGSSHRHHAAVGEHLGELFDEIGAGLREHDDVVEAVFARVAFGTIGDRRGIEGIVVDDFGVGKVLGDEGTNCIGNR